MLITTYQDPGDFLLKTRATLEKDEVINSLLLGVASGLKKSSLHTSFYLATIEDESGLLAAACMTPPHNVILYSKEPENEAAFAMLIENLQSESWSVPGAIGPAHVSENFAKTWTNFTGQQYKESLRERVFKLDQVIPPSSAPGMLRIATENNLDLISQWMLEFLKEALHKGNPADTRREAENKIRIGSIYIWETPDKHVVSMAAKTRPIVNVISIGWVYTPPVYRGMGYASNCVAALSQLLLDEGWKCCTLFTDLSNPTSNSIYQKIGYQPVCDFNEYVFVP